MTLVDFYKVSPFASLVVVAGILGVSIVASLIEARREREVAAKVTVVS
jgi:hypothetical protein